MLKMALPVREAFSRLAIYDKNYIFNPTDYEWDVMEIVYPLLTLFHKATNHFSGRKFPNSNDFFPDICEINLRLNEWKDSDIDIINEMAVPMKEKFDKYWDMCNLVLSVAVVFDPSRKIQYVEFKYTKIYNSAVGPYIERVRESLNDLFISYGGCVTPSTTEIVGATSSGVELSSSDIEFDEWCCSQSQQLSLSQRAELETYLDERKFPSNESFDVIKWWKDNKPRLPNLASIARDILAVPATKVASEATFSLGGRILDEQHSSMSPDAVEALVVLADWLELDEMTQTTIARNVESYEFDNDNQDEDAN